MKSFEIDAHVGMEGSSISNVHGVTTKNTSVTYTLKRKHNRDFQTVMKIKFNLCLALVMKCILRKSMTTIYKSY